MRASFAWLALLCSACLASQDSSNDSRGHASSGDPNATNPLVKFKVVPDVIRKVPQGVVNVNYGNGTAVCMGNTISPQDTSNKPTVSFEAQDASPPYTLVMVDPDAPSASKPIYRSWLHWVVVNAPSSDRFGEGEEAVQYNGPAPPKGSGQHRYVFLIMAQNGKNISKSEVSYSDRRSFNFERFLKNNSLPQPLAANFFFSENPGTSSAKKSG
uniref:Putative phosphatidylethanolamine-binding protein n=1 Tax=Ixodes scapularis TaxID=6945 RepID=A0A4D5RNH6_IXOSC